MADQVCNDSLLSAHPLLETTTTYIPYTQNHIYISQLQIVQLDPQTKALQLRSGPEPSEIHLGSIADANLFLRYNGSTYVGYSYWNPDVYGLNGVLLSERASGIPLHTTLELLCSGRLDLDVREAFFDEFVADDRRAALRVWIRWGQLYHVKRLRFYALPPGV